MLARHAASGPPAMSYLIDDLWAEQGVTLEQSVNVRSWRSVNGLFTVQEPVAQGTPAKRPTYGLCPVAGTYAGKNVVNFDAANSQRLYTAAPLSPPIFAAGSRPYVASLVSIRNYTQVNFFWTWLWSFANESTGIPGSGSIDNKFPGCGWEYAFGLHAMTTGFSDANYYIAQVMTPQFIEVCYDASGFLTLSVNRVLRATGTQAISMPAGGVTRVCVGFDGSTRNGTCTHALLRACSQRPPDAERDALYQWTRTFYVY